MIAATCGPRDASLAARSAWSMAPSPAHLTTTTRSPASTALAALVPCADSGIRQMSRPASPRAWW